MKIHFTVMILLLVSLAGCNPFAGGVISQTPSGGVIPVDPKDDKQGPIDPTKTPVPTATATPKATGSSTPVPTATSTPIPTSTSGGGQTCTGQTGVICKGGYDAAQVKKKIPAKIIFMDLSDPSGTLKTISDADQKAMAEGIVQKANDNLVYQGHKLIQFDQPQYSYVGAPSPSTVTQNIPAMIDSFGSTEHYVLIIVKNFMNYSSGVIGYSPGLRINWKSKESIVVMDYNYIKTAQSGTTVIVHELFHGLGAMHTTDNNGSTDNVAQAGFIIYKDMKYGAKYGGGYMLKNRSMAYDFNIYIEDQGSFLGVRNHSGFNWDTRTMMYQYAKPYPLFLNSDTAFNGAYSNILNVYYDSFVK